MGVKFKFKCACGRSLAADSSMSGKRAKCPSCAQVVQIPALPEPKLDDLLDTLPLDNSPAAKKQNQAALSGAPVAGRSAPSTPSPPPLFQSPPAPQPNSIWDEVEADDYQLQAAAASAEAPCPKCGTSMSSQAVLCINCGYNRQTGISTATDLTPLPSKKSSPFGWLSRKKSSGSEGGWRVPLITLAVGVAIFVWGFNEMRLSSASSSEPEKISLAKLIERGADGNPNVILTDYLVCEKFVYEGKGVGDKVIGAWKNVWVPIVPYSDDPAALARGAQNPPALIYSTRVKSENDVLPMLQSPELRGMVTNRITSLKSRDKELLGRGYPAMNFDRCIIFHEGREPKSSESVMLILAIGGVLTLAGGGLGIRKLI